MPTKMENRVGWINKSGFCRYQTVQKESKGIVFFNVGKFDQHRVAIHKIVKQCLWYCYTKDEYCFRLMFVNRAKTVFRIAILIIRVQKRQRREHKKVFNFNFPVTYTNILKLLFYCVVKHAGPP